MSILRPDRKKAIL